MHFKAPQPSRSAGVMLLERKECHDEQLDLCGAWLQLETRSRLYQRVDWSATTYGKHRVFLGSSFHAHANAPREGEQGMLLERKVKRLKGETFRRRLAIPLLGGAVGEPAFTTAGHGIEGNALPYKIFHSMA
jgi:hypothetical protein